MSATKFVSYIRVSTQKQGRSGLGLEAQQSAVAWFVRGQPVVAEFVEVETGKGSNALEQRPQLKAAMDLARKQKATLVIAKLDRLARNVHFISGLIESGVDFVAADMPQASKAMLQMHAVMSEWERDQISARTKAALAAAKARGVKLGTPANLVSNVRQRQATADAFAIKLAPVVRGLQAQGLSQRGIAAQLSELGIKTPTGKVNWTQLQVQNLLKRLARTAA